MTELARSGEPVVIYRAQGKYALSEKFVQDLNAIEKGLREVERDS